MVEYCGGLDLAASATRPSGVSIVEVKDNTPQLVFIGSARLDEEIIGILESYRVGIVAIDSPLQLPEEGMYFRRVDLKAIEMGFRLLPPAWRGMKMLTLRAIRLSRELKKRGITPIETHPSSGLKSSGCRDVYELTSRLGLALPRRLTRDERDALIAALVCFFYFKGMALSIREVDGEIVLLPRIC